MGIDSIDLDALHAKLVGLGLIPPVYTVQRLYAVRPLGTWSLAGAQDKVSTVYGIFVLDEAGQLVGRISADA